MDSIDICIRNLRDTLFNTRKIYLTCDFNSKLYPKDISKELNTNVETVEKLITKCKGKISKNGIISFKNIKSANNFENKLKEEFADIITLKTIIDEETINFVYSFYNKPGFWDFIEEFWSIFLLVTLAASTIELFYSVGKLLIVILRGGI